MRIRVCGTTLTLVAAMLAVVAPSGEAARAAWAPPAVTFAGARTAVAEGGSTGSISAAVPAGAAAGDTLIVSVSAERALRPTLTGVTGLSVAQEATDGGATAATAYKTLTRADTGATVTASVTSNRRMSLVVAVYRNVGSVVATTAGPVVQANGATALSTPAVTPDRGGATLVGVVNYLAHAAPWTTTFAPATGWTERADVVSSHPSAWNAATWLVDRTITGGGAQPGGAGSSSFTGGGHYFASTLALAPRTERERRSWLVIGVDEPTADHTGVLPDVPLEPVPGDLVITAPGTYENLDVQGMVHVRASNVTIRNVRVRGAAGVPALDSTLIEKFGDYTDVLIEHVTLRPDVPRPGWNSGIAGHGYTLRFADISGTTDGIGVFNFDPANRPLPTGVVLEQNYVHDLVWWSAATGGVVHPSDTQSHNDAIQFQGGSGAVVRGNSLHAGPFATQTGHWRVTDPAHEPYTPVPLHSLPDGGPYLPLPDRGTGAEATGRYNWGSQANIMLTSSRGVPNHDFTVTDNWLYGGNQSVNGAGNPYAAGLDLGVWLRNRFDRTQGAQSSGGDNTWTLSFGASWAGHVDVGAGTTGQNVYQDTGTPVRVRY